MQTGMFWGGVLAALVLIAAPVWAEPHTYGFYSISNNNTGDVAIGEAQLSVEVSDPGSDQVVFTFRNAGTDASSIARIYFDDFALGLFTGIAGIENGDGVSFGHEAPTGGPPAVSGVKSKLAGPPILPGGKGMSSPFEVTAGLVAMADAPAPRNGVNPDEWVGILLDLSSNVDFDEVVAGMHSGDLRIGLHVIGFDGGGSESFVIVPAPAAAVMGLLGLGMAGLKFRKRV